MMKTHTVTLALMACAMASGVQLTISEPGGNGLLEENLIISDDDVMRIILKSRVVPAVTEYQIAKIIENNPDREDEIRQGFQVSEESNSSEIVLILTNKGMKKFYSYSKEVVKEQSGRILPKLDFRIDGKIILSPTIREPVRDGIIRMKGSFSWKELEEIFPENEEKFVFDR